MRIHLCAFLLAFFVAQIYILPVRIQKFVDYFFAQGRVLLSRILVFVIKVCANACLSVAQFFELCEL